MDSDLSLEFLRVVEQAAIACAHTMGQGDRHKSDHAAVEAMRSSRHWAILQEMNAEGGWLRFRAQEIWEFADALDRGFAFDGTGGRRSVREFYAPEFCLRPL